MFYDTADVLGAFNLASEACSLGFWQFLLFDIGIAHMLTKWLQFQCNTVTKGSRSHSKILNFSDQIGTEIIEILTIIVVMDQNLYLLLIMFC